MKQVFLLVPASKSSGITTVAIGLQHLFDQRGVQARGWEKCVSDCAFLFLQNFCNLQFQHLFF